MPRITCKTPSNGRPLRIVAANVATSWATIVDAPDFSVPDTSNTYPDRDPGDAGRAIRPGEVFLLSPLYARNKTGTARWIEFRLLTEGGTAIMGHRALVPANETVALPVQGRSFMKRVPAGANGDRLQVQAEAANTFDVWAAAEEKPASEHIGVVP